MKNKLFLIGIISLLTLGASTLTQANNMQVMHRVHVGGPDACDSFGLPQGCDANFSITAMAFANGKIVGKYTDRFAGGDGFQATIDCLSVNGNDAWVSGTITKGHFGDFDFAGLPVITRVRDNGVSQQDTADQIGFSFIGDPTSCDMQPDMPLNDVTQGQVVVM